MNDSANFQMAMRYAKKGRKVLPLHYPINGGCSCGDRGCGSVGKHPIRELVTNGKNSAVKDLKLIEAWFREWPLANVGMVMGDGMITLDVDAGKGGYESLHDLGELPDTVTALTGGGGQHLVFLAQYEGGSVIGAKPGLDIIADGYIVCAPSLHESGRRYEWEVGHAPGEIAPAPAPAPVLELLNNGRKPAALPLPDRIPDGERDATLASLAGTMRRRGASMDAIFAALVEENAARCDPPLSEREIRRIASSISRYAPAPSAVTSADGVKATALGPVVVTLNTVEREEVAWLWRGRLALGKPTCLMGDPGVGKSYITAAVGTAVSLGKPLPGEAETREPAGVLYLACEDGVADTMAPRFQDMGADMARIHVMTGVTDLDGRERHPSLVDDLPDIERAMVEHHCKLLVVDPINAYLGSQLDTHRDAALRGALAPLSSLCERLGVACIFVMHLTKSGRDKAIYRAQGSIAYIGLSRVTLLAGANAENPDDRAVIWVKGNNSEPMPSIGYEIMAGGRFCWIPGESSLTKEQCLAPEVGIEATGKIEEAETFLTEVLADGPKLARELIAEARKELGISARTVKEAKGRLGVRSDRFGYGKEGGWRWYLDSKGARDTQLGNLAPFDESVSEDGNEGAEDCTLWESDEGRCDRCGASISVLNESGLCGRCATQNLATNPREASSGH